MPVGRLVFDEKPTRARSHSPCELGADSEQPAEVDRALLGGSVQYHQVSSFPNLSLAHEQGTVMDCTRGFRAILNSLIKRYQQGKEASTMASALSQCTHLWAEALLEIAQPDTRTTGYNAMHYIHDISAAVPDHQLREFNHTLLECALLQGLAVTMLQSSPHQSSWNTVERPPFDNPETVGSLLAQLQAPVAHSVESGQNRLDNNATAGEVVTTKDVPSVNTSVGVEGLHIPQLDLDALLGPPASEEHCEVWRRAARRAVQRKRAPAMGNRLRSVSDFDRSSLRDHFYEAVDLRPAWMRSAALSSVLSKNLATVLTNEPFAYVEWNIVGFQRVVAERLHDRIVSPEIHFRPFTRIDSALQPHSLRLMVTLNRPPGSTGKSLADTRLGIEFTVAEPIEVLYRIVSSSHVSQPRWHGFNEKPWAGLQPEEAQILPNPAPIMLTVGVLIESIRRPRLDSVNSNTSRKNTSSGNVRQKGGSGADFAQQQVQPSRRGNGSDSATSKTPTRVRSQSDWPTGTRSTVTSSATRPKEAHRVLPSACLPSMSNLTGSYGGESSVKDLLTGWARATPAEAEKFKYSHTPLPMQKSLSRMQLDRNSLICEDPQRRQLISRIWTSDSP